MKTTIIVLRLYLLTHMNNIIDFIFLVNVKGKVGASRVQLALAKVAYKKQVFSLFQKTCRSISTHFAT